MLVRIVTLALATMALIILSNASAATTDIGWVTNGGNYNNDRYSPLTTITPGNISKLSGAWRTELPGASSKAAPIVDDGVMYVAAGGAGIRGGGGAVYALDAKTGAINGPTRPRERWESRR